MRRDADADAERRQSRQRSHRAYAGLGTRSGQAENLISKPLASNPHQGIRRIPVPLPHLPNRSWQAHEIESARAEAGPPLGARDIPGTMMALPAVHRARPSIPPYAPSAMVPDSEAGPSTAVAPIVARVALFSIIGIPLAAYLWDTLNRLVAGDFSSVRLIIAVPTLLLFILLILYLSREVWRWEGSRRS
jgi:hypothetical protein